MTPFVVSKKIMKVFNGIAKLLMRERECNEGNAALHKAIVTKRSMKIAADSDDCGITRIGPALVAVS